jgi:RecQ-mediated genome instability protein 1
VRQTRIDRADLAGLNAQRGEDGEREEEDEGPIPRYPRAMLRMDLSDGTHKIRAIEYKKLPDLVLGETPLGFKVCCASLRHPLMRLCVLNSQLRLKNTMIRRGIAFLEPDTVEILGGRTEDRDEMRDTDFVRSLRVRMGYAYLSSNP